MDEWMKRRVDQMDRRMTGGLEELRSIGRESPKRAFGIAQVRNGSGFD